MLHLPASHPELWAQDKIAECRISRPHTWSVCRIVLDRRQEQVYKNSVRNSSATCLEYLAHNHSRLFPQKRDLIAKRKLRLDEVESVEVIHVAKEERKEGCEHPEKLKTRPEECTPEQIRECHGDVKEHPCAKKE